MSTDADNWWHLTGCRLPNRSFEEAAKAGFLAGRRANAAWEAFPHPGMDLIQFTAARQMEVGESFKYDGADYIVSSVQGREIEGRRVYREP